MQNYLQRSSLTELRNSYLRGLIDKKQFEGLIFQYLQNNYERYYLFRGSLEEWEELLLNIYPRISKAIDKYEETGAAFDSYIGNMIHWAYKERKNRDTSHGVTEYSWWKAQAEELSTNTPEAVYGFSEQEEEQIYEYNSSEEKTIEPYLNNELKEILSDQQILILFLKSYYFITEGIISKVAETLDMDKELLWEMVEKLRVIRKKREDEIREIEAGIECQYYRCIAYQKRLVYTSEGSANEFRLTKLLERAKARFAKMRKRLRGIRFDATNRQIASVLNVPKGSIDSSLHSIRKKSKNCGFSWNRPLYSKQD